MKKIRHLPIIAILLLLVGVNLSFGQTSWTAWDNTGMVKDGEFSTNPLTHGWVLDQGRYSWPGSGNPTYGVRLSKLNNTDPDALLHQDIMGLTGGTQYKVTANTDFWGTDPRTSDVHVWLRVFDLSGNLLNEAVRNGGNDWITLEAVFIAPADGRIRIQLTGQNYYWETEAYWDNVVLYQERGKTVNDRIIALQGLMTPATTLNIETAYAQAAIAVAWKFQPFIQADLTTSHALGLQNITSLENGLQDQINALQNQIQNGANSYLKIIRPRLSGMKIQNGDFYVGNVPVVVQGPHTWLWDGWNDRTQFGLLGYNSLYFVFQPTTMYDDNGYLKTDTPWWAVNDILAATDTSNLYVSAGLFNLNQVWQCVARRGSVTIESYRQELANLVATAYANIAPGRIKNHVIATEGGGPCQFETARHLVSYQTWLQSEYRTIGNYNTICGTAFSSFPEVTFPSDTETNPGRKYDRYYYLKRISADELKWAADLIHSYDPNATISGYPANIQVDGPEDFYYSGALDPEMNLEAYGLCDADTTGPYTTDTYAMATIDWICRWRDQMGGLGPGKPQIDSEFHPINLRTTYPAGWLSAMSLQGYVHGLSASNIWTWVRSSTMDSALLMDAKVCLDASKSALDLARLAAPLAAFHRQIPDVAFLYSQSSMPNAEFWNQTSICYEGLYFEGVKLGFISDKQVVNGGLARYKLLIVPSASYVSNVVFDKVNEFLANGGTVCLVGSCFGYTERRQVRSPQLSSPRLYQYSTFSTVDAVRSALLPRLVDLNLLPPVTVQVAGSSSRVVEWRYAKALTGTDQFLYLFNMGKTPVTVTTLVNGVDLVSGTPVASSLVLNSLEKKVIKFTNSDLLSGCFYDGFETNNFTSGGWVNIGADIQSTYRYAGNYAARLGIGDSLTKPFSTANNKESLRLTYARRTLDCASDDHFICEWYDGSSWVMLEDLMGNNNWGVKSFNLPTRANNNPNFQVRFRTIFNGSTDYACLDDVRLEYMASPDRSGDANGDGKVDVSDLGILAANYGTTNGATWAMGDFNGDGRVDVSDLGILAANYGTGTGGSLDFNKDARALGLVSGDEESSTSQKDQPPIFSTSGCGSAGFSLIAGIFLAACLLFKESNLRNGG